MEMDVVVPVPVPGMEFNFDSACSSPYMTAPSSPQRVGGFLRSAPASPVKDAAVADREDDEDFAFDFSGHLERTSLSADELFDGGKIRPLRLHSLSSSVSSQSKDSVPPSSASPAERQRGRERKPSSSTFVHKGSRSLSPMRVSDIILETEDNTESNSKPDNPKSPSTPSRFLSIFTPSSLSRSYRKWRLKDLLLFRSASEGRATGKDAMGNYAVLPKRSPSSEEPRNSSFRSTESVGSVSRRRGQVSAHELHYTVNRAAAEEMRKKTFLPYRQGLLGCLGFGPGPGPGVHEISRGIGSLTRG